MLLCCLTKPTRKPESSQNRMFAARSHTFAALSLTLSAALASQANAKNISNYLRALPAAANAGAVAVRLNYSARPTFWGQHPASLL